MIVRVSVTSAIAQQRILDSVHRVDLEGGEIHHRSYSIPSPQSLYHIDGNHKLR